VPVYDAFISYSHAKGPRATQESPMPTLRQFTFAALALIGASVPLAAYTGFYAPACTFATVWTLSGVHYQYVCF
jgi:hypothetical protein